MQWNGFTWFLLASVQGVLSVWTLASWKQVSEFRDYVDSNSSDTARKKKGSVSA